jgi:hypothetical protein
MQSLDSGQLTGEVPNLVKMSPAARSGVLKQIRATPTTQSQLFRIATTGASDMNSSPSPTTTWRRAKPMPT